jgi:hypothetical protein
LPLISPVAAAAIGAALSQLPSSAVSVIVRPADEDQPSVARLFDVGLFIGLVQNAKCKRQKAKGKRQKAKGKMQNLNFAFCLLHFAFNLSAG